MRTLLNDECNKIITEYNKQFATNNLKTKLVNTPTCELANVFYKYQKEKFITLLKLEAMKNAFKEHIKNKRDLSLIKEFYYSNDKLRDLDYNKYHYVYSLSRKILESYKWQVLENIRRLF